MKFMLCCMYARFSQGNEGCPVSLLTSDCSEQALHAAKTQLFLCSSLRLVRRCTCKYTNVSTAVECRDEHYTIPVFYLCMQLPSELPVYVVHQHQDAGAPAQSKPVKHCAKGASIHRTD